MTRTLPVTSTTSWLCELTWNSVPSTVLLAELQGLSNPTALTHVQYDASQTRQSQEFYDLLGHRLAAPQKGICIVKTTLSNGTTTTRTIAYAD